LIARENEQRGATDHRDADRETERCRDPLLPFVIDAHVDLEVCYHSLVPIGIVSENNQHWPDARIERAAALSSQ
jgi:hypothetical protein